MTYQELLQLNRAQLIEAQEQAILTQDHETLRRIANILTGFANYVQEPATEPQGLTWLNEEVEDVQVESVIDEPSFAARFNTFLTRRLF